MQLLVYFVTVTSALIISIMASLWVRHLNKKKLPPGTICVDIPSHPNTKTPGTALSRCIISIAFGTGMILLFATLLFSIAGTWELLPSWIIMEIPKPLSYIAYSILWLYYLWGILIIRYNVNYTPCYRSIAGRYYIATAGPYSIMRHPMYAAKAAFPIIMFCATGFFPFLIGLLSWTALRYQSIKEEEQMVELGGNQYRQYLARTGRFSPRLIRK